MKKSDMLSTSDSYFNWLFNIQPLFGYYLKWDGSCRSSLEHGD